MKLSKPGKMNHRISFVKKENSQDDWGEVIDLNVIIYSCWAELKTQFLNEVKSNIGTVLEDTVTFIIRHNPDIELTSDCVVEFNQKEYKIVKMTPDEALKEYDTVIAKKVS